MPRQKKEPKKIGTGPMYWINLKREYEADFREVKRWYSLAVWKAKRPAKYRNKIWGVPAFGSDSWFVYKNNFPLLVRYRKRWSSYSFFIDPTIV